MVSVRTAWRKNKDDERISAIREDVAMWLNSIMGINIPPSSLMEVS